MLLIYHQDLIFIWTHCLATQPCSRSSAAAAAACCAATQQKDKHCSQKLPDLSLIYSPSLECVMNINLCTHCIMLRAGELRQLPFVDRKKLGSKTVVSVSLFAPALQLSLLPLVGLIFFFFGIRFRSYTKALLPVFNIKMEHFGHQDKKKLMCSIDYMTLEDLQALKYVGQQITNQCYKEDQPLY